MDRGLRPRRFSRFLAVLVTVVAAACSPAGERQAETAAAAATVIEVVDGDTFDVEFLDGAVERVRPPQIDAPEVGECGYQEATSALEELILGAVVRLVPTTDGPDRDAHGRLLRAAELGGRDVGEVLVATGLARWVPRYAHEDRGLAARYEAAEAQARESGTGLWSACGWA
jgi:endonuclease YncB( thermonuclease family)